MNKNYKKIGVIIILIILVMTNIIFFAKFKELRQVETASYSQLVNRFYVIGIMNTYSTIQLVNEKIKKDTTNKEDVKTWLLEITSDMKLAAHTSSIASNHWNLTIEDKNRHDSVAEVSQFFENIQISLYDIIQTEKDYSVWKQACIDLEEILEIMKSNTNEQVFLNADYKEIKTYWKELMKKIYEKHSESRLLKSYFKMYYFNDI
ncbi:hypothetical protein [Paenibacillus prosopidis]|uniref:Chemotaxis methyl-accepting receptor HlyB-like 4HB MCP domain-containing protein n=1 Tax=Paenibacillus prosopidis TaxID=630520 RepID=A0A368VMU3_9BACL|nr:hypothetical protein [Paenibacillus prosopidis]RCW42182.1 hypothetical protein DFP97_11811 [Paenibacillus prosopidis]